MPSNPCPPVPQSANLLKITINIRIGSGPVMGIIHLSQQMCGIHFAIVSFISASNPIISMLPSNISETGQLVLCNYTLLVMLKNKQVITALPSYIQSKFDNSNTINSRSEIPQYSIPCLTGAFNIANACSYRLPHCYRTQNLHKKLPLKHCIISGHCTQISVKFFCILLFSHLTFLSASTPALIQTFPINIITIQIAILRHPIGLIFCFISGAETYFASF
jgi:hypothetical protein